MGLKQEAGKRALTTAIRAVVQAGLEEGIPHAALSQLLFAELMVVIEAGGPKSRQAAAEMPAQLDALILGHNSPQN